MRYILGKKVAMTQIFSEKGDLIPVTVVQAGPCVVTQVRTQDKDGYVGVQVAYGKKNKISKPLAGHFNGLGKFEFVKEFRDSSEVTVGDVIKVSTFEVGDKVKVTGISKGKGFQGVVKRHGFAGASASHGTKDQVRMPGSIGATGPAHVFKGQKMPGQMGAQQSTMTNLEIVQINEETNELYIKGGIPGARNSYVVVHGEGDLKVNVEAVVEETKSEEPQKEAAPAE